MILLPFCADAEQQNREQTGVCAYNACGTGLAYLVEDYMAVKMLKHFHVRESIVISTTVSEHFNITFKYSENTSLNNILTIESNVFLSYQ